MNPDNHQQHDRGSAPAPPPTRRSALQTASFAIGSLGLMLAMGADTLAVIGRHLGLPLLGAIEIVQTAIVLLATAAMVIATQQGEHASIHILTDRVRSTTAARMKRLAALISAGFCLILVAGCLWVSLETWHEHERSELLHISFRWQRLLALLAVALMVGYFIKHALKGNRS